MSVLKCTKIVRDFAGIEASSPETIIEKPPTLGNWYVNMFIVDRKKTLIFMNERTLLSFISFGIKQSNIADLPYIFLRGLEQLLRLEEVPISRIERVIEESSAIRYAKTDSRSALANMNDLTASYKYDILYDGGFSYCNIGEIIHNVNRRPQKKLGWRNSVEALRELL